MQTVDVQTMSDQEIEEQIAVLEREQERRKIQTLRFVGRLIAI